jgi:hypothetical protein
MAFVSTNMIIGDQIFYDVEVTDEYVDYGDQDSFIVRTPLVARGINANNIYFNDNALSSYFPYESKNKLAMEHLAKKIYGAYQIPDEWIMNPFKNINYTPKNNMAAKRRLVDNPDEL